MREGNKFIAVYPSETYSVSYSINFPHPLIGKETFQVELSNGSYLKHIAAARTFGSRQDEQAMRNMGLIRGASTRELHCAHSRWHRERPAALSGRICPTQGARSGRRSGAVGEADLGETLSPIVRATPCTRPWSRAFCVTRVVGRSQLPPRTPTRTRFRPVASKSKAFNHEGHEGTRRRTARSGFSCPFVSLVIEDPGCYT